ncbi:MAG: FAD-dependent oxidoreductase [Hyphomicrobiaceae bacterium]|nr:FAD-dependent oxidoreductase [Hyphomicrobiaceae bacterium]
MANERHPITVAGAGITGLWQALTLARRGHRVRLMEASAAPFAAAASRYAGAMLGPYCETEMYAPVVTELGLQALDLWRAIYPSTVMNGTLVVAPSRDIHEIEHFARLTAGHQRVDSAVIAKLEPDLAGRFSSGLFYRQEGHLEPQPAMQFLLENAREAGVEAAFGIAWLPNQGGRDDGGIVIDCRGLDACAQLPGLRGIRGERIVVRTHEIALSRPVRLLHPRHPLYVVPWSDGRFMIGATVIESDDAGPVTVRSALELLGAAYALHPAFGEAEIIDAGAGVRPAFADHVPRVVVRGRTLHVNGLYRHGFLLAPALAVQVANYLDGTSTDTRVVSDPPGLAP